MNFFRFNQVIDVKATGANIRAMREQRGLTVKDVQTIFGFDMPQAVYRWEAGLNLPSVDNLFLLAGLFGVKIDDILIPREIGGDAPPPCGGGAAGGRQFPGCLWLLAA